MLKSRGFANFDALKLSSTVGSRGPLSRQRALVVVFGRIRHIDSELLYLLGCQLIDCMRNGKALRREGFWRLGR